jgi:predicted flap endonuclease-1-like 5' DNA nuclease
MVLPPKPTEDVMGFTLNQWAILALVLLLGWLLGLASRSGGGKWKRAYRDELAAREAADSRLATANARIAELERSRPVAPGTAAAVGAAAAGQRDDLSLIRGIGRSRETTLNEDGIHRYQQIESLSAAEADAIEARMGLSQGTIAREEWREQALMLRERRLDDHRARYV